MSNANDQQLRLVLTRPEGYNSGRFILRYDCGFRGIPIELEYRSIEISSCSSDVVVRRSRSCFVVGEISRVTVWFVSGGHISSTPTVVNATSGEGESLYNLNIFTKKSFDVNKKKINTVTVFFDWFNGCFMSFKRSCV